MKPQKPSNRVLRLLACLAIETKINGTITTQAAADRALYHLLQRWRNDLPEVDHNFHKKFRQCNVTDLTGRGQTDVAIHLLIGTSPKFWDAFKFAKSKKPLTDEMKTVIESY